MKKKGSGLTEEQVGAIVCPESTILAVEAYAHKHGVKLEEVFVSHAYFDRLTKDVGARAIYEGRGTMWVAGPRGKIVVTATA